MYSSQNKKNKPMYLDLIHKIYHQTDNKIYYKQITLS